MYMEGRPWSVVAFAIMLATTSVRIPDVGGYASGRQSAEASDSQVLAWGDHKWSGCVIGAHPAPKCVPREQPVVNDLVLDDIAELYKRQTNGGRFRQQKLRGRRCASAVRLSISVNLDSPKLIGPFSILQCG